MCSIFTQTKYRDCSTVNKAADFMLAKQYTVKPRPEAHMDMILFEVFLKSIDLIPQQQILQRHHLYYR